MYAEIVSAAETENPTNTITYVCPNTGGKKPDYNLIFVLILLILNHDQTTVTLGVRGIVRTNTC
jgi:hypothetical protein